MSSHHESKLFQPLQLGDIGLLQHRVALAPLTRMRSELDGTPSDMNAEYYGQRGQVPGTLLLTEGTLLSPVPAFIAPGLPLGHLPGAPILQTKANIRGWKKVTDAVHAHGSFIVVQLTGLTPQVEWVAGKEQPRWLTPEGIQERIDAFVHSAKAAMEAGFDGIELHFAQGLLVDQFIQSHVNRRPDKWGGSLENRLRFPFKIWEEVSKVVPVKKIGFRISPFSTFQGMRMPHDDLIETFSELVRRTKKLYPDCAYMSVLMPRIYGDGDEAKITDGPNDDFLREIWGDKVFIAAGGFTPENARERADSEGTTIVAFGRHFSSNPDLPRRLRENLPLTKYDRPTFYEGGPRGYLDWKPVTSEAGMNHVEL